MNGTNDDHIVFNLPYVDEGDILLSMIEKRQSELKQQQEAGEKCNDNTKGQTNESDLCETG